MSTAVGHRAATGSAVSRALEGEALTTTRESTVEQILMLERTALDRWGAGDPGGYLNIYAADVTYFDPVTTARIDGLDAMREYYHPWTGKIRVDRCDMLNPRVVVTDDVAVLTYNLINFISDADGAERLLNRWNSTAVYQRHNTTWKIVHSYWSYMQPTLANAEGGPN
jgi:ketosteroid isomerase-like protein